MPSLVDFELEYKTKETKIVSRKINNSMLMIMPKIFFLRILELMCSKNPHTLNR